MSANTIARAVSVAILGYAIVIASAGACFVDIDESLLDAHDASSDSANDGNINANADAEAGGASNDGSLSDGGSDGGGFICPSGSMVLCDDFERAPANVLGPWALLDTANGGTVTIEGTAPDARFMRGKLGANTAQGGKASLNKEFGLSASTASLSARIRYDIDTDTTAAQIFVIGFRQAGGGCQSIELIYQAPGIHLAQENTCASGNLAGSAIGLVRGTFQRVEMTVAVGGLIEVRVDGVSALTTNTAAFVQSGFPLASVGVSYASSPYGNITVDLDDVVFTAK